jgi:anti-sigma B factor antagonist
MRIMEQRNGSIVRISLRGELDIATVGEVHDTIIAALAHDAPSAIVLDMRLVTFIDSTAIGQLVTCHRAAAVCGATLTLENLSPFPHRQLWATGLLGLFGLAPDAQYPRHVDRLPVEPDPTRQPDTQDRSGVS